MVNPQSEDLIVTVTFNEATRKLLDGRNFATLATLRPDGRPQSSVMWVMRDGDTVLFSTTAQRQKARNLARDARVSVSVFETENPYNSVEIRGTAELIPDDDKALPNTLSHKYLGVDPPAESDDEVRVLQGHDAQRAPELEKVERQIGVRIERDVVAAPVEARA